MKRKNETTEGDGLFHTEAGGGVTKVNDAVMGCFVEFIGKLASENICLTCGTTLLLQNAIINLMRNAELDGKTVVRLVKAAIKIAASAETTSIEVEMVDGVPRILSANHNKLH
jgi:hypothetical protein